MELVELSVTGTCREHLAGWGVRQYLFGFQMSIALGDCNGETSAPLTVMTVLCLNLSAMHLSNGSAQVQTDTRSLHAQITGIATLVETLEKFIYLIIFNAHTRVNHLYLHFFLCFVEYHLHFSSVKGVFEGIGE